MNMKWKKLGHLLFSPESSQYVVGDPISFTGEFLYDEIPLNILPQRFKGFFIYQNDAGLGVDGGQYPVGSSFQGVPHRREMTCHSDAVRWP